MEFCLVYIELGNNGWILNLTSDLAYILFMIVLQFVVNISQIAINSITNVDQIIYFKRSVNVVMKKE